MAETREDLPYPVLAVEGEGDQGASASRPGSREEWRPVLGFEGTYEVSNLGRVRSSVRGYWRVLRGALDSHGYPTVKLSKNAQQKRYKTHRLVCAAFKGPAPQKGMDCAHLDGNPANPNADNLAWVTRAENMGHKRLHGTLLSGEKSTSAKLTKDQVAEIRRRAANGESRPTLAREYGVARGHLRRIVIGEVWQ